MKRKRHRPNNRRVRRRVGRPATDAASLIKRYSPPGSAPGTLGPPAERAAGTTTLSLVRYGPEAFEEKRLASLEELADGPAGSRGWLRVYGHEQRVLAALGERLGVHPLVLEDVVNLGQRAKFEEFDRYLFIVVDIAVLGEGDRIEQEQISLLVFDDLLVSIQERESALFRPVEERLAAHRGKLAASGAGHLAYALVDTAVDQYFPVLDHFGDRVDEAEEAILDEPTRAAFEELHGLKRELLALRKASWPLRELVAGFQRSDSPLVPESTRVFLRDVYDHTVQIIDITDTFREMTAGLVDLYLTSVSNRTNEIMKVLTIMATLFIPLTFIVGVYGMNFQPSAGPTNMPELTWEYGYVTVWAVMGAVALGLLAFFKRRDWL